MTFRTELNAMKETRKTNLDFLSSEIRDTIRMLRALKELQKEQESFGLSDAIDVIDRNSSMDPISSSDVIAKMVEMGE